MGFRADLLCVMQRPRYARLGDGPGEYRKARSTARCTKAQSLSLAFSTWIPVNRRESQIAPFVVLRRETVQQEIEQQQQRSIQRC